MICPDLIGQKFGSLTVVKKLQINNHKEMTWLCKCDCGNDYVARTNPLTHGKTTCCHACAMRKISISNTKHSREPKSLWYKYQNMKTRCHNPNYTLYHRYGGRGIKVCKEWDESFEAFRDWALANGYSDELTIDRIDNDGNYCPENCRWATVTEQANNRSTSRIIVVNGEKDTLANWARRTGTKYSKVQHWLDKGMSGDEVFGPYLKSEKTYVSG